MLIYYYIFAVGPFSTSREAYKFSRKTNDYDPKFTVLAICLTVIDHFAR